MYVCLFVCMYVCMYVCTEPNGRHRSWLVFLFGWFVRFCSSCPAGGRRRIHMAGFSLFITGGLFSLFWIISRRLISAGPRELRPRVSLALFQGAIPQQSPAVRPGCYSTKKLFREILLHIRKCIYQRKAPGPPLNWLVDTPPPVIKGGIAQFTCACCLLHIHTGLCQLPPVHPGPNSVR